MGKTSLFGINFSRKVRSLFWYSSLIILFSQAANSQKTTVGKTSGPASGKITNAHQAGQVQAAKGNIVYGRDSNAMIKDSISGSFTKSDPSECANPSLEQLTYMGQKFNSRGAICVRGVYDDSTAFRLLAGGRAINPGNPEYGATGGGGGRRDRNNVGYYFIVFDDRQGTNRKQRMCENPNWDQITGVTWPANVSAAAIKNLIQTRWEEIPGSGGDGRCMCGNVECSQPGEFVNVINVQIQAAQPKVEQNGAGAQNQGGATSSDPTPAAAPSPAAAPAAVANSDFSNCMQQAESSGSKCRERANEAKSTCERVDRETAGSRAMQDVLGAGSQISNMMNAGKGVQATCFKASVMAMGARELMQSMMADCNNPVQACAERCKDDSFQETIDSCARMIGKSVQDLENESDTSPEAVLYRQKKNRISRDFDYAYDICGRELKKDTDQFSRMLDGLGSSLQSSLQCACQTSSAGNSQDCASIPNPDNCAKNPGMPGCDVYGSLNTCVPGSPGYDARMCSCMQNPGSPGCNNAGGQPPPSLFGGNLRPGAGSGFAGSSMGGLGGSSGGGRASGVELSGGGAEEIAQAELRKGSGGSSSGSALGGGGGPVGGMGGASGGPGEEGAAAAAASEESGIKGLFNQARNAVMNAFGKGSGNSRNSRAGAEKEEAGGKKRKLRGLASGKDIGTKNMDIWRMVNMCANGETCISNRNNYVETP